MKPPPSTSAVIEAEGALQVVNVLRRIERRVNEGHWQSGNMYGPGGDACLVGAIDESVQWTLPGVETEVTQELAKGLPRTLRPIAWANPRVALMTYNDLPGGKRRVRRLLATTLDRLGIERDPRAFAKAMPRREAGRPAQHPLL